VWRRQSCDRFSAAVPDGRHRNDVIFCPFHGAMGMTRRASGEVDVTTTSLAVTLKNRGKQVAMRVLGYDSRNWLRIRRIEALMEHVSLRLSPNWC
jgi:hypothetical protein